MSFWWRVFRKRAKPDTAPALRLAEQLRRKAQNYQKILAVEERALAILAQVQSLPLLGYASPAYVQLASAAALSYAREAVRDLTAFTKQQVNLEDLLRPLEERLNQEMAQALQTLKNEPSKEVDLPFEGQSLSLIGLLASGCFSPAPPDTGSDQFIIDAVWGWGLALFAEDGFATRYLVTTEQISPAHMMEAPSQETRLTWQPETGLIVEPLPQELSGKPLLTSDELQKLMDYYNLMAEHLGGPVQLRWGLTPQGEVLVLNAILISPSTLTEGDAAGLLHSGGVCVCPGRARGPVYQLAAQGLSEPQEVPEGAIIWTERPALSVAPWLEKAAALIVENGAPHNHLALLARSHGIPTIFNTGRLVGKLSPGMLVRVDATTGQIWDDRFSPAAAINKSEVVRPATAADKLLAPLAPWLFPLRIVDWSEKKLAPDNNRSLHELLYLTAQARVEEMFRLSLKWQPPKGEAVSLVTGQLVPIVMLDGGGGLSQDAPTVGIDAVSSMPFQALLKGMMSIPWPKGRPVDVKGFMSVIGSTTAAPRAEDQLEKISFALITKNYMNFSLCLGYHASTVEAYIGNNLDNNYVRFHYQGGAASLERRLRRLQLIGGVLTRLGFRVKVSGDLLDARLEGESGPVLTRTLEILGKLEVYTKQMDMLMSNDAVVQGYIDDFLATHFH